MTNIFPPPPSTQGYSLRKANENDLDDITKIHIEGFVEEPMDNYCYPYRFDHTEDHFRWMKEEYQYYLDNPEKFALHVAEAPEQPGGAEGARPKPMAIAVWNTNVLAKAPPLSELFLFQIRYNLATAVSLS